MRRRDVGAAREAIMQMRKDDKNVTATEMAHALGVSPQRVRQLLVSLGLPTRTGRSTPGRPIGHRAVPRLRTGGVEVLVSSCVAGTIGELVVAADLYARGWRVFGPIGRHNGYYDLIAVSEKGRMLSIEVRCGRRTLSGTASFAKKTRSPLDHFAVVITGEPVLYVPDLPGRS